MSAEKKQAMPPNVYEVLDRIAQQQEQQGKQLELLAKGIVAVSEKVENQPKGKGSGSGDFITLLKELAGGGKGSKVSIKDLAKAAQNWATFADAVGHYRRPVLPYSGADRFLMRAGARSVYQMRYEGVKTGGRGTNEKPTDEDIDRMLGFLPEKREEAKESESRHKI